MTVNIKSETMYTALVGGGKISEQHLISLDKIHGTTVKGICDLSPALARFSAERFSIPNWYNNYQEMLAATKVDVVHVLTPAGSHEPIVRDCLERGKHVIVEKPVALSYKGFQNLWNLAKKNELLLIENHNYRFNEPINQLSKLIIKGDIGSIEEIEVRISLAIRAGGRYADENLPHQSHKLPAGVLHEFITHLAYLFLHILPDKEKAEITAVKACWRNHGDGKTFQYDDLDALVMAGKIHGRLRFSCHQWPDSFAVQVRGSDGMASAELFHPCCRLLKRRGCGQHLTPLVNAFSEARTLAGSGMAGIWNKIRNRSAYEGLSRFLELTYESLRSGGEPPVTYSQMAATSQLVDQLLAEENRI